MTLLKDQSETNKQSATIDLTTSSGESTNYNDANFWVDQNYQFTFIDTNPLEGESANSDINDGSYYYTFGSNGYSNYAPEITFDDQVKEPDFPFLHF